MLDHILIRAGTRKPHKEIPELPSRAVYDIPAGYWSLDGEPLASLSGGGWGAPVTKKFDIETGEDQKGE